MHRGMGNNWRTFFELAELAQTTRLNPTAFHPFPCRHGAYRRRLYRDCNTPRTAGYQIIEGHHRVIAATELGFKELPCVIENLDDIETNIRLLSSNQQEGNDPLDIGLNALDTVEKSKGGRGVKSELSVSGFARAIGKKQPDVVKLMKAGEVLNKLIEYSISLETEGRAFHLFEIHAPRPAQADLREVAS